MNYPRKKIALLIGALIIGQALTMQNTQAMETTNTENITDIITNSNLGHKGKELWDDWSDKVAQIKKIVTGINSYHNDMPTLYTNLSHALSNFYSTFKDACNMTMQNPYTTKPVLRLIPGISICDTITNKIKSLYNNASTQGRVLYNQASDKAVVLKNEASKWCRDNIILNDLFEIANNMPKLRDNLSQAANKNFWIKAAVVLKSVNLTNINTQKIQNFTNNSLETVKLVNNNVNILAIENIMNPNAVEAAIDNKIADPFNLNPNAAINSDVIIDKDFTNNSLETVKLVNNNVNITIKNLAIENIINPNAVEAAIDNKIADPFNLDPNAAINSDVIIDKVVKKPVYSLAMYTTAVTAALFTTYKTYMYAANKYQEYQKDAALNESIKQHLTDEKKAEIEQSMGKELSDNDVQEIINNIKTHATAAQDNHVTQAIVDLVVKEYINKQTNV